MRKEEKRNNTIVKAMRVYEINSKGIVFKYKHRTYFLDKYDTHKSTLSEGDVVLVVIIVEKENYGFVTTVKSLLNIYKKILTLPTPTIDNAANVILEASGYYYTISNILLNNMETLYTSNCNIGEIYTDFIMKINKDEVNNKMYTYEDLYNILKLLQVIEIEQHDIQSLIF